MAADVPDLERLEAAVSVMARIGACYSPSFSPDGRELALLSNLTGVPQVWVVATGGGWPDLASSFTDPVVAVRWSPDGAHLAASVAPSGGLNQQTYVLRPHTPGSRRLSLGGRDN